MSKVFFDKLVVLEEISVEIKNISQSVEEKEELWKLVDDIVNHRVILSILDRLPIEHHEKFLSNFYDAPHDEAHFDYLNEKMEEKIEDVITNEIHGLKEELLHEIKLLKSKK